jgi:NitT/TauT family transport system substrate-binding protein
MADSTPPPAPDRGPIRLAAVGLVAVAAAALALWQLSRQRTPLAVAITNWPGYEYLYLAEQKQLGRPYGLDLTVQQFSSLLDQRQAFERGDVPLMATTLPEAIAVCQEAPKRCPELILVLDQSLGADRVLARAPLARPQQLLGRRVGLERAVLAEYILLRSLGDRPVVLDRAMRLRFDGPVALVEGLKAGDLDAIVTYHPYDASLIGDSRIVELFSSRQIPGEIVDVLAVDPVYSRSHRRELKALVQTWWAARDFARRNPGESNALMAQRQQLEPAQFEASQNGLQYPMASQQRALLAPNGPLASTLRRMADLMQSSGRIRADAPLPVLSRAFLEPS